MKDNKMKITILNGSPEPSVCDRYLDSLRHALQADGHIVTQLDLRDLKLSYCIGCFGCWVKTPGVCGSRDASIDLDRAVINSDFTLWASPLRMGFPTTLFKMALDKHLPLIHPYMEVDHNEVHHKRRYPRSPRLGLLLEPETSTDQRDLQITTDILNRTALNFKSRLEFSLTTQTPTSEIVKRINSRHMNPLPLPVHLAPTQGITVNSPNRLTLFNGSPRGRKGNTPIMLEQITKEFNRPSEIYHLVHLNETADMVSAFSQAECALIGFPLYTDAMPGVVKHFFEALEPLSGRLNNPPLGFLVQSGFPEGLHARYVERYLEKLAKRLGSPYLGTIVKGGGEGTRIMPESMTAGLFKNLQAVGTGLAARGVFDPDVLHAIAQPERFSPWLVPLGKLFLKVPLAHSYFDTMLRDHGVFDQRFAKPFLN
jgi:multimeric flavodoxin WrbA